jgi:cell division protein FtsI/penicillin-binding protein 2
MAQSQVKEDGARLTMVAALFFLMALLIGSRLFYLQVLKHSFYEAEARKQHGEAELVEAKRGLIYSLDRNNKDFAIADNRELYLLFAVPCEIKDATTTINKLSSILELNPEEKLKIWLQLKKENDPYEPLRHYLKEEEKKKIEELKIAGLNFLPEVKRFYPDNNIFSHITGFVGFKGEELAGRYGLEEFFEKELKGALGEIIWEKDPAGRLIGSGEFNLQPAQDGTDIYLNIDRQIQFKTCGILAEAVAKSKAEGGVAIVQDPNNGAILALCNEPNFDPNNYGQVENIGVYTNQAVVSLYEPGSIFKAITMAAALESGVVGPETTYEDKGVLFFDKDKVTNAGNKVYGWQTMTQVLENSINTGAVFAAQKTGRSNFKKYVKDFGFGSVTGIELPGEAKGDVAALDKKGDIYLATNSFGQGLAVTPIQMISAFSAIANGGTLWKPWLIKKTVNFEGQTEEDKGEKVRRVISEQTANILKAMLVSVVENGHAKVAQVKGYFVGGKTGTAQIPAPSGGYLNAYNHSFVGFAPAINSRFVVLVKITNPQALYAESTAAPAFAEIMGFLLNYYQIATER